MIKSGSAKIFIWQGDTLPDLTSPNVAIDTEIEPEDQKDPLVIRVNQSIHEIKTDDSFYPLSRKQKGLSINLEISLLGNLNLFNLGLISTSESSLKGERWVLSQNTGSSFKTCSVMILPYPFLESNSEWRDSSIFVSNCEMFIGDFSTEYNVSDQRSWKLKISSTSNSDLVLGLGNWIIPGSSIRYLLQQINTETPSYLLFEDGTRIILGVF